MPLWLPLTLVFAAVFVAIVVLLSAGISAYETRQRRLELLRDERPMQPQITVSAGQRKRTVDPAPLLTGILQNSSLGKQLQLEILRAGLVWRPSEFLALCAGCALVGYLLGFITGGHSIIMALLVALVASVAPYIYLKMKQSQRQAHLSAQIPDMLDILCASLRSGHSFLSGCQVIVSQMAEPISEELGRVVQEVKFGASISDALDELVLRSQNYDMELIISAVQTQLTVGGNLAEILEQISTMIRDRVALAGEISATTAEGRMSAAILVGLPFLLAFMINTVSPGYLNPLFTDPMGRLMLIGAVVLVILGVLIIRKMLDLDL